MDATEACLASQGSHRQPSGQMHAALRHHLPQSIHYPPHKLQGTLPIPCQHASLQVSQWLLQWVQVLHHYSSCLRLHACSSRDKQMVSGVADHVDRQFLGFVSHLTVWLLSYRQLVLYCTSTPRPSCLRCLPSRVCKDCCTQHLMGSCCFVLRCPLQDWLTCAGRSCQITPVLQLIQGAEDTMHTCCCTLITRLQDMEKNVKASQRHTKHDPSIMLG